MERDWLDALQATGDGQESHRKRTSRACDECRKTKSRCYRDGGADAPCSSCYAAGIACTFNDPTFKRGPPKGYIQAIEQRLHQVESVLGTILSSTDSRAQSIIRDLRNDRLADHILDRVDHGPFGPAGRTADVPSTSYQEAFARAVTQSGSGTSPPDPKSRVRRGTREDRENMLVDSDQLPVPTLAWQDQLLSSLNTLSSSLSNYSAQTAEGVLGGLSRIPVNISLPTLPPTFPAEPSGTTQTLLVDIPTATQHHLVDIYFRYVHPCLPVINKTSFFLKFNSPSRDLRSAGMWSIDPREGTWVLLLLCMYTVASRYSDPRDPAMSGEVLPWRKNCYVSAVRSCKELSSVPALTTCQALLILAYEEVGLGSLSHAWLLTGMAIRMAQDLYLHDNTKSHESHGPGQITECRRIWWTCILMDRYVSIDSARPSSIGVRMYDTPFPHDDQDDISEIWIQRVSRSSQVHFAPVSFRPMLYFSAISSLSLIIGAILDKMFALDADAVKRRLKHLPRLQNTLENWIAQLPPSLYFDENAVTLIPPDVILLHMHYWATVLLLYRNVLPSLKSSALNPFDDTERGAYNASQAAASWIVNAAAKYDTNVSLKSCPPFVVSHLHMAGVMHIYSLSLQRSAQTQSMLERITHMLGEIESVWPSATKSKQILNDHLLLLAQASAVTSQVETHARRTSRTQASSQTPQAGPSGSHRHT